jgi:hypothetical protein
MDTKYELLLIQTKHCARFNHGDWDLKTIEGLSDYIENYKSVEKDFVKEMSDKLKEHLSERPDDLDYALDLFNVMLSVFIDEFKPPSIR